MPARTFGAVAVATALVLLPTTAHAADLGFSAPAVVAPADQPRSTAARPGQDAAVVAGPADLASTVPTDPLVVLGLVVLVGGAMVLTLSGRRPDDDEPAD